MSDASASRQGEGEDVYVADLLRDAKLLATYGLRAGLFKDNRLYSAIAAVETPPLKAAYSQEVIDLQAEMNRAIEVVPFSTLVELRGGWKPGEISEARTRIYFLIALSILLMFAIGSFSQIYNRGVVLLSEIQPLSVVDPEQRYGQLVRELIVARRSITAASAPPTTDDELKRNAYFQTFAQLRELDKKLSSLAERVGQFEESAQYPIPGSYFAVRKYYEFLRRLGWKKSETDAFFRDETLPPSPQKGSAPAAQANLTNVYLDIICPSHRISDIYSDVQDFYLKDKVGADPNFISLQRDDTAEVSYLNCFEGIQYSRKSLPVLDNWVREINDIIAPYNLWIMPSLFGMIGAAIFHLRLLAKPLEPNPKAFRIIHRIAFGALAGMALAWFWVPEVRFGVDLPNIGIGLFAMAFIVGFSLDVFFTLLDRFVAIANTAVGNIGMNKVAAE